uniref:Uncharacterized protein n=1 Tax=Oryza meridionalis TaxID=40149 RepID=A0A0E0EM30_9ORYZ
MVRQVVLSGNPSLARLGVIDDGVRMPRSTAHGLARPRAQKKSNWFRFVSSSLGCWLLRLRGEASSARRCGCGVVFSGGSGGETAGWRHGHEMAPRNGGTAPQDSGGTRRRRRWGRGREEPRTVDKRWRERRAVGASSSTSSRASGGSPGRADSCERWDAHKTPGSPASSTGSNGSACRSDSVERWDNSKRPLSRASSAERWDINKKPRPEEDYALCSGKSNSTNRTMKTTTSAQMISKPHTETMVKPPPALLPSAGPAYFSAPDPSMLSMPTFLLARCR